MTVTFCGHSQFRGTEEYEQRLLGILEEKIGNSPAELYLGGYGQFDSFALRCGKKYKQNHPNTSLIFVTPYLTVKSPSSDYDCILYPELENVPPRFAISHRNRFMVERADLIIACIEYSYGGAYQTYKYAKRKGKEIIDLANFMP